jgi:phospholipid/cholesterol/gamma-HCH transport system substrate-binding protein
MESDKHYFIEGLFVIVLSIAVGLFFVWLARTGNKDDVLYRIHFSESVSGLTLGDPVKFLGVDIGTVKEMAVDPDDPHKVRVDVKLRKDAPVKTDTKAMLQLKGITGVFFIELNGGSADAKSLVDATPAGKIPEIPSERSSLNAFIDQLPKLATKFASIEDQTKKVVNDVGEVTTKIKENPSLLLRKPKEKKPDETKKQ